MLLHVQDVNPPGFVEILETERNTNVILRVSRVIVLACSFTERQKLKANLKTFGAFMK